MSKRTAKPTSTRDSIAEKLREEIVSQRMGPGTRVPTRLELTEKFGTSIVTVQRALERLIAEGFLSAHGRNGTVIADTPPHLSHYALIMPAPQESADRVRFWTALSNEAQRLSVPGGPQLHLFNGVDDQSSTPGAQRLLHMIREQRLAGLIFANPPRLPELLGKINIPRVAMMSEPKTGFSAISLDMKSFWEQALDYLIARGRKRIAFLCSPWPREMMLGNLKRLTEARNVPLRIEWVQAVYHVRPEWSEQAARLLFSKNNNELPDGLIIADDNMVEAASTGLVAAGVRVPEDVEVVAHCNFPWPAPSVLRLKRLGFDANQVLRTAMDWIDKESRGEEHPEFTRIAARFEEVEAQLDASALASAGVSGAVATSGAGAS